MAPVNLLFSSSPSDAAEGSCIIIIYVEEECRISFLIFIFPFSEYYSIRSDETGEGSKAKLSISFING
ncbi:MAG: hypothetical protein M3Z24_16445, partial [Chloroflexota bacterium]|nr:hypothetical protein [Chloroflexota bacterium]